jgi:HAD superfamily hydrolase (TIGR01459 family)
MDRPAPPELVSGLSEIAPRFGAILCDVWGVVHNGIVPFAPAVEALTRFREGGGIVILVTNAPRPNWSVQEQLDRIGVQSAAYDRIVTSGDVARGLLAQQEGARVFHLGPDRDLSLYEGLRVELSSPEEAAVASCTGLIDDETEVTEDYDPILLRLAALNLNMVCANPDIVVERGDRLIPCAGALAVRYRALGGRTIVVGKPFARIYEIAMAEVAAVHGVPIERERILAVGDGAATDIRGANEAGLASLFITAGIHSAEYGSDPDRVGAFLGRSRARATGMMQRLAW